MSLQKVTAGGLVFVVDAPNKGTAKAFGRKQIEVTSEDASASDVTAFLASGKEIVTLTVAEKAEPAAPAADPAPAGDAEKAAD